MILHTVVINSQPPTAVSAIDELRPLVWCRRQAPPLSPSRMLKCFVSKVKFFNLTWMHLNKRIVEQHYYYQMKGAVEEMSNMAVLWSSWFTAGRHWLADSGWSQANTSRLYAGCSRLVKAIGITLKWPSVIIYLSRDTSIIDPRTEKK